MQQAQKSTAETEPQRLRSFRFKRKRRVVELQFLQRVAQALVFSGVRWIEAAKHHRFHGLESGKRFTSGALVSGDGITDPRLLDFLDTRHEEAHLPSFHFRHFDRSRSVYPYTCDFKDSAAGHHPDLRSFANSAVEDAHHYHRTMIRIEPTIDDQRS